ncbi:hypothetical protein [Lysinibacillus irui]|uniref:Uncharacterized protein n=1 Tax=Lysinibacillus irui TaxID=2998077 RepID=A0AAJ5RNC7_9BACI|nr:hypothetical protein [Lysinibacillus irui]WDV07139.1 hypothetical protein OU989_01285 [Lysinibacillus irui]
MKINVENMNQFMNEFEYKVFPTIKGSDGQGIERLKAIVEEKRMEVTSRKIKREIYEQITKKPKIVKSNSIENEEDYQKINFREDTYRFDIKFDSKKSTNIMSKEGYKNNNESAHMISGVNTNYSESKYKIA